MTYHYAITYERLRYVNSTSKNLRELREMFEESTRPPRGVLMYDERFDNPGIVHPNVL
jgi:hypothetical protein